MEQETPATAQAQAQQQQPEPPQSPMEQDPPTTTAPATAAAKEEGESCSANATATSTTVTTTATTLVPQLAAHQITEAELATAVRVLQAVASLNQKRKRRGGTKAATTNNNNDNNGNESKNDNNNNTNNNDTDETDGLALYKRGNLRPLRKALAGCLELHRRTMFQGQDEDKFYEQRQQQRSLKRQKISERTMHQKYLASTQLRRGRVERLQQLQEDAKDEEVHKLEQAQATAAAVQLMIPDGPVATNHHPGPKLLESSSSSENPSSSAAAATATTTTTSTGDVPSGVQLPKLRSCYVCKVRFRQLHHFYDQLCPACAALNWDKRHQSVDLTGRTAVVTGSRVKIGYQVCLKLLRAGAHVVATTRFPHTACRHYRQEPDFDQFASRLQVYGLDLRDVTGLEAFTRYLRQKYPRGVDVLINNACQTVRRPVAYYRPLVEQEQSLWHAADETHLQLLTGCREFERIRRRLVLTGQQQPPSTEGGGAVTPMLPLSATTPGEKDTTNDNNSNHTSSSETALVVSQQSERTLSADLPLETPFDRTGLTHSAAMSQMILLPEDAGVSPAVLPAGLQDVNGQPLDLRTTNSWLLKMDEVSTPELMECMFINAIAPFVLNARLKPLMTTPQTDDRPDRYIINVSAMEGKFYRYKMPNHPHTNMAKAALNMLTRTSAEDLAVRHRIFMNSVDTGWINDENPLEKAKKTAETNLFQTPIDEVDAAARIVDPIFVGVREGKATLYGKFLKDYRESEW